jgi:hypothetical protein
LAYSAIKCVEIYGNCCAFHASAIGVFIFAMWITSHCMLDKQQAYQKDNTSGKGGKLHLLHLKTL